MILVWTLALHTLRECYRRPFPYVAGTAIALLALASHLFQAFSFGAGEIEAANLAISAVFLAGVTHATFQGTQLVRADLERGTLGLLLAQPVGLPAYLAGRFLGLLAGSLLLCAGVASALAAIFLLPISRVGADVLGAELLAGWGRTLLPIAVLDAAALAASTIAPRVFGPLVLLGLLLATSVAGHSGLGWILPDFSVFGLVAGADPPLGLAVGYTLVYSTFFVLVAYLVLEGRPPLRSQA